MLVKVARQSLRVVPDAVGFALLRGLASRAQRFPALPAEEAALSQASRFLYGRGRAGWSWGDGPPVVLVHGWSGSAAQMAPLALHLSRRGFRAVAFDVSGHGKSNAATTSWTAFFDDIAEVTRALATPLHAYVGHSAGALSVMARRGRDGIGAARYVSICAPCYPFPMIAFIERLLNPSEGVMEQYRHYLAGQFGTPWETLETGVCFAGAGPELLSVFDLGDRVIALDEMAKVQSLCPRATVRTMGPFGHTRILPTLDLARAVEGFLATPSELRNGI